MKRAANLFERIVDRENLRLALSKALRGKRTRWEARRFLFETEQRLRQMADELRHDSFQLGRYRQFVIYDPKERTITAPCFAERVLHHAIMNVCEPVFERWLIHDSYACRVGRGRVAAIERAQQFARGFPYFLKMDVRKYFDSVAHEVLASRLRRLFKDERLLGLLDQIIFSFQAEEGHGLPIGSLTSQHFANFYLGWFDRFVKESLRVKGYVRYMDDMILWGPSAQILQTVLDRCREFLADLLRLEIKDHPYINRTSHGVDFLGCRVFSDHVMLNRRSRIRYCRKMAQLENDYLRDRIDDRELQERAVALTAFTQAAGAKSWKFRTSVLQRLPVSGRRPPTG